MGKKVPVTISVDDEVWNDLKAILKDKGYPKGCASWLAQETFRLTTLRLEHGAEHQLDLFFNRKE